MRGAEVPGGICALPVRRARAETEDAPQIALLRRGASPNLACNHGH